MPKKKMENYVDELIAGKSPETVASEFINEQPKLLSKIAYDLYQPFSKSIATYEDVRQEVCLAAFTAFSKYNFSNTAKNKTAYICMIIKNVAMRQLNNCYCASGFRMDPATRKKHSEKNNGENPFVASSLEQLTAEGDNSYKMISSEFLTPEDMWIQKESVQELQNSFSKLSENEKKVLVLTYVDGLTVRNAAKAMDCSKTNAAFIREKASEKIKKMVL